MSAGLVELKRSDDGWLLTMEGYTEAGAVGGYLWPAGVPAGVNITALVVVEEPVQMGQFELTGLTLEALRSMEEGAASRFAQEWPNFPGPSVTDEAGDHEGGEQAGSAEGGPPMPAFEYEYVEGSGIPHYTGARGKLRTLRIWFKTFIPDLVLAGPPGFDCFLGDNRSYSSDLDAPCRMHSELLLSELNTTVPTTEEKHWCGATHQVNCDDESIIDTATAGTEGMKFYNFRYPGAVVWDWSEPHPPPANPGQVTVAETAPVTVDYIGAGANPLVPGAPMIDIEAHISYDLSLGIVTVSGKVDDFPAFEGYISINDGPPLQLFALDRGASPISLFGGTTRPFYQSFDVRGG